MHIVLKALCLDVIKYSDRSHIRKKAVNSAHSSRSTAHHGGEVTVAEPEGAGHIALVAK